MNATNPYPRYSLTALEEALGDTPVVLIHGSRQCGKTTLARMVGDKHGYDYFSFDDTNLLASAERDPVGFVSDLPAKVILDEVQRVPSVFLPIKAAVDKRREPGRFLLTGSSNVLLAPKLSDSLAGRLEIVPLAPLAQCELARHRPSFLGKLFDLGFPTRAYERLGPELARRIVAGGYPAALARSTARRRTSWYHEYIETLVQRDVQEMARISSLHALPRLLSAAAAQTACLFNASELAAPFQLSRPTVRDYLTLLERIFLIELLPPWHSNRLSRLVKTPKLHLCDTGLACAMLGLDAAALYADRPAYGALLETFAFQELRRQGAWHDRPVTFLHFREKDGAEVDVVIERGARELAGVEIKASSTVTAADFRGLRKLRDAAGTRFRGGVVLYDGEASVRFDERLWAVPVRALWEK